MSRDAPIYSCASCGFRNIDLLDGGRLSYELMSLNDMQCLQLNDVDKGDHIARMESHTISMPFNKQGEMKHFNLWKAWSIWPQEKELIGTEDKFYHLHHTTF